MTTKIAEAVEPLRTAAMDRAEQFARRHAAHLLAELDAAGGDAEISAPYPGSNLGRSAYVSEQMRYQLVRRLTRPASVSSRSRSPGDPDIRVVDQASIERFVQDARQNADEQYSAFIAKLEAKIGQHSIAILSGDHVWDYSLLSVETPTGRQNWKTQSIINVSKLGKVFNQWPSRRLK